MTNFIFILYTGQNGMKKAENSMKKVNVRGEGQMKPTMYRKLRFIGGSYVVTMPAPWVHKNGLKRGDLLALIFGESVRITPVKKGE